MPCARRHQPRPQRHGPPGNAGKRLAWTMRWCRQSRQPGTRARASPVRSGASTASNNRRKLHHRGTEARRNQSPLCLFVFFVAKAYTPPRCNSSFIFHPSSFSLLSATKTHNPNTHVRSYFTFLFFSSQSQAPETCMSCRSIQAITQKRRNLAHVRARDRSFF